ncbi:MAG: hypothetical protein JSR55_01395 [Proteobacteria bacterium]|nr:hypothetical protein [Pseudomonadota bacterium]
MIVTHGNGLLISAIFWGAIVLIVFVSNFFGYRERTSRHRMIEKLAEKGQPIPPELLSGNGYRYSDSYGYRGGWHRYSLAGGIYMMCVGVALFVFLWAMTTGDFNNFFGGDNGFQWSGPGWLPFVGIFPFMIGFSRVLAYFFDRPRTPPQ